MFFPFLYFLYFLNSVQMSRGRRCLLKGARAFKTDIGLDVNRKKNEIRRTEKEWGLECVVSYVSTIVYLVGGDDSHTVDSFVGVVAKSLDMLTSIQPWNIVWAGLPGRDCKQIMKLI